MPKQIEESYPFGDGQEHNWGEHRLLVMQTLKDHRRSIEETKEDVAEVKIDLDHTKQVVAVIKSQNKESAKWWGSTFGFAGAVLATILAELVIKYWVK